MTNLRSESKSDINLELLAKGIVEGIFSGLHRSPFHGFSSDFSERKPYNIGDSSRFLDWKYFAKTDKKFIKKYEEETNLRCHIVLDVSSSMYFPKLDLENLESSKISYSILLAASLLHIIIKQRDAIGFSAISDSLEFYVSEKSNRRHVNMVFAALESYLQREPLKKSSNLYEGIHKLAEKFHKRSLVIIISDFVDSRQNVEKLFDAIKHLSFNKHEIILFQMIDRKSELSLGLDSSLTSLSDIESGLDIELDNRDLKNLFSIEVNKELEMLKSMALKYKMDYELVDISQDFSTVLNTYLTKRKKIF